MSTTRIYSGKATPAELLTNGIGALDATFCEVSEEINGEYSVEITIPVNSANAGSFVFGAIVKASTPKGTEYFQLDMPTATLEELSAKGWQISGALGAPVVLNAYIDAKTGAQALPLILASSPDEQRFTGTSDIALVNNMRTTQQSPLGALMNTSVDNCFLNRWGGEVDRNKFIFNVKTRIGSDKGYKISLGKNLLGVKETPTGTGYTNRIIPKCLSVDDTDLFLPEIYIDSPLPNLYDNLKHSKIYKCESVKVGEVDSETGLIPYPTVTEAYTKMRSIVAELYAKGADVPGVTIDISFLNLKDTEEYKQFKDLLSLDIQLGDTVYCTYFNRSLGLRVSAYKWNSLGDKFTRLTIGDTAPNIAKSMYAQDVSLAALQNDMNGTIKQGEKYNNVYINHTDGFVAEAAVGANNIKTAMNASEGISIYKGAVKIFYIDSATGNIMISGTATSADMASLSGLVSTLDAAALKKGVSYAGAAMSAISGFTSTATVAGQQVVVNMSAAAGGMNITKAGVQVGGIADIGGIVSLIAGTLTNTAVNPDCWATIGTITLNSRVQYGIFVFLRSISTTVPAYKLLVDADGLISLYDKNNTDRIVLGSTSLQIKDASAVPFLQSNFIGSGFLRLGANLNDNLWYSNGQMGISIGGVNKVVWS